MFQSYLTAGNWDILLLFLSINISVLQLITSGILEIIKLVITKLLRFLKSHNCFYVYLGTITVHITPFFKAFKTLLYGLGCFPLVHKPYRL